MNLFLQLHLLTIVPGLVLGPFILSRKQGDKTHKFLGRIWVMLMIVSCFLSFGIAHNGSYSWLHLLGIFTIYQVIRAMKAIKAKNLQVHKRAMIGSYLGSVGAFIFAASVPQRIINKWILEFFS